MAAREQPERRLSHCFSAEPAMNSSKRVGLLLAVTFLSCGSAACQAQSNVEFGSPTELRTDSGRLSFGTIISADVVSWSAPDAQDLLIARLWDGVYLYPSNDLQTIGEPVRLCDQLGHVVLMVEPVDWDGDGREEAIGTDPDLCGQKTDCRLISRSSIQSIDWRSIRNLCGRRTLTTPGRLFTVRRIRRDPI